MKTTEKQITVSNEELYQISLKLDCLHTAIDDIATKVDGISLSEDDKQLETKDMPKVICSSILYLLSDYSSSLNSRLREIISKAGGEL